VLRVASAKYIYSELWVMIVYMVLYLNAYQGCVGLYENCKHTNSRMMAIICVALF